nr:MAG TPA: hypothetical protein [Caudoviricetes sp.]
MDFGYKKSARKSERLTNRIVVVIIRMDKANR